MVSIISHLGLEIDVGAEMGCCIERELALEFIDGTHLRILLERRCLRGVTALTVAVTGAAVKGAVLLEICLILEGFKLVLLIICQPCSPEPCRLVVVQHHVLRMALGAHLPYVSALLSISWVGLVQPCEIDILVSIVHIVHGADTVLVLQQCVACVLNLWKHGFLYLEGREHEVGLDAVVDAHGLPQSQYDAAGLTVEAQLTAGADDIVVRLADEHIAIGTNIFRTCAGADIFSISIDIGLVILPNPRERTLFTGHHSRGGVFA